MPVFSRERVLLRFKNRRGDEVDVRSVSATEAKNEFGRVRELAIADGAVAITRHDAPRAVLLSVEEFNALAGAQTSEINMLTEEFDDLLARMQTPAARRGVE